MSLVIRNKNEPFRCWWCHELVYMEETRSKPSSKFCRDRSCCFSYYTYEKTINNAIHRQKEDSEQLQLRSNAHTYFIKIHKKPKIAKLVFGFGKPAEDVFIIAKTIWRKGRIKT